MRFLARVFAPTDNRRLNELVGFLLFVSAGLLLLALASYSPLDPSLNTAGFGPSHGARNWIGIVGSVTADIFLQTFGLIAFGIPPTLFFLALRWFRSQPTNSPIAKLIGSAILVLFFAALLGLCALFHFCPYLVPPVLAGHLASVEVLWMVLPCPSRQALQRSRSPPRPDLAVPLPEANRRPSAPDPSDPFRSTSIARRSSDADRSSPQKHVPPCRPRRNKVRGFVPDWPRPRARRGRGCKSARAAVRRSGRYCRVSADRSRCA